MKLSVDWSDSLSGQQQPSTAISTNEARKHQTADTAICGEDVNNQQKRHDDHGTLDLNSAGTTKAQILTYTTSGATKFETHGGSETMLSAVVGSQGHFHHTQGRAKVQETLRAHLQKEAEIQETLLAQLQQEKQGRQDAELRVHGLNGVVSRLVYRLQKLSGDRHRRCKSAEV